MSAILTCTPTELTLDILTPNEYTGAFLILWGDFEQPDGYVAHAGLQYYQVNNVSDGTSVFIHYDLVRSASSGLAYDAPFIFPAMVLDPAESVEELMEQVSESDLSINRIQSLLATLQAAGSSFERENLRAAVNQLGAFQNKVWAQVAPMDADLAAAWIEAAQDIIDDVGMVVEPSLRKSERKLR